MLQMFKMSKKFVLPKISRGIIPRVRVGGYQLVDISNKREWNNRFKNASEIKKITRSPTIFVDNCSIYNDG